MKAPNLYYSKTGMKAPNPHCIKTGLPLILLCFAVFCGSCRQGSTGGSRTELLFEREKTTTLWLDTGEAEVVHTAVDLLRRDIQLVFNADLKIVEHKKDADIVLASSGLKRPASSGLKKFSSSWLKRSAVAGPKKLAFFKCHRSSFSKSNSRGGEAFRIRLCKSGRKPQLIVSGSEPRGLAYGILELSRMIGVSPWHYFADSRPKELESFEFPLKRIEQQASVKYRGIFINDEDWGLMPWASQTLAPQQGKGVIGPEAYEKIFELLLRLRANTIWPAMHECTRPFYQVEGNAQMARKYGILLGSSHCEPLARNSASEWDMDGSGDYNFMTNPSNVIQYWAGRLQKLSPGENIFTLGMRGKHDGLMQGVKTLEEHKAALSRIIPVQQDLLKQYIDADIEAIPQVFIPYKEVMEVYDAGLEVPDHVTLVWCDDNYGYIRRLSNAREQERSGASGIYYHVSYWGRPHDYLWLASTSPGLIYSEMLRAYKHGADRLWILNVGDIKPAEYLTEYFLDLAWDINAVGNDFGHLQRFMHREFGAEQATALSEVYERYYRLATIRKPEFMGWSRVEESGYGRGGKTPVRDTEYHPEFNKELQHRLEAYREQEQRVAEIRLRIPVRQLSCFFQLVEYPIRAASLMNQKWLYARLARYYSDSCPELARLCAALSLQAYENIEQLTATYNSLEEGKWERIMDFRPRELPVFDKPVFNNPELDGPEQKSSEFGKFLFEGPEFEKLFDQTLENNRRLYDSLISQTVQSADSVSLVDNSRPFVTACNAVRAWSVRGKVVIIRGLGHSFEAVQMPQGSSVNYCFDLPEGGEYRIVIAAVPNHDVDGQGMKIRVAAEGRDLGEFDYKTRGRSEAWKQQVLRGQALIEIPAREMEKGRINISITALSPYIQLDQLMILQGEMNFYEFPVGNSK